MVIASTEKPMSGAYVDIIKVAQQIQHLAHFLSQGYPIPGIPLSDNDLKTARVLSPVTNITSHRRHSDLEFPREWVEDDGVLATALREWRRAIDPTKLSNTAPVEEIPVQIKNTPTETDIEADANVSFMSYSMKREAHWDAKMKELERKLRQCEQEKESVLRDNLKLQRDVEVLQRRSESFHRALFDPDNRIHETNMKAKVKLHAEIRELKKSLHASETKNESLVEKNKKLELSNKGLVTENEELVKKTEKLELSNFDLVTENAALDAEIKDLDSDNQILITMSQALLDKRAASREAAKNYEETLIAGNQALAMKLAHLETDTERCAAQAKDLNERYDKSVMVTESCEEKLARLTVMVNDFESSKDFLTARNNDLLVRDVALGDKSKRLEASLERIVSDAKCSLGV
ncbi:uncharacterized protein FSUBG_11859 [Fusarium subglutinans]|uniref:Uncharacterized protein n=1 Tax=Gibberella subglutinans TaxID=42677 RepID=A0A8H5P2F2_GIBSU|nr:uncharacterized protein FSUBG_11859 [Fusarium subglutinans]KAF5587319.1 hypothetical protein FSUBG_11859 [Fusarium subglutinans]